MSKPADLPSRYPRIMPPPFALFATSPLSGGEEYFPRPRTVSGRGRDGGGGDGGEGGGRQRVIYNAGRSRDLRAAPDLEDPENGKIGRTTECAPRVRYRRCVIREMRDALLEQFDMFILNLPVDARSRDSFLQMERMNENSD